MKNDPKEFAEMLSAAAQTSPAKSNKGKEQKSPITVKMAKRAKTGKKKKGFGKQAPAHQEKTKDTLSNNLHRTVRPVSKNFSSGGT